jgi:hypothetical protein
MTGITIDVSEFLDFAEQMGAADDKVKAALLQGGNAVTREGAQIAKSILASNDSVVTGGLYNDITGRPAQWAGDTLVMEYGPNKEYPGSWVEHGRKAVSSRSGGYLVFRIKGVGPLIYTKRVGPARPRPFMRPSVARLRPIATKTLGDAAMRAIESMI